MEGLSDVSIKEKRFLSSEKTKALPFGKRSRHMAFALAEAVWLYDRVCHMLYDKASFLMLFES